MTMRRCMGCMNEIDDALEVCPHCGYVRGTAPREAYHLPPESILEGRYIAGRVLGYGGFGVTYIGWDAQLERKVAIKEFLPSTFATRMPGYTAVTVYAGEATEQFEAGLHRFVDEAQRLAKFNGIPGIVDIYDTFVQNNTAYIVMEYLQGQDVKDLLNANGPLPYERARDIVLSVCDTLKPVHAEGIIHRDIAPDNIYITSDGQVKLLDFGASRYATSINSKSLSVILKSGYAPEEQYRSRGDQGPWSDVYALAATFYKMLTGVTPDDSMERAIRDELKEPSRLGAELPKSAENAIMNALQIKKENRTQTAEDFKQQLLADGVERVKVKPPKSDRMPLWQKVLLGGGAAVVLIFALLTLTGVIDLGQGNLLRDTFGSGLPAGHVNAPGLINQSESEAKRAVARAGVDFTIVGKDYSDQIEKGKILTQEPLPGRVIAKDGIIEVRMSGGSLEEARASGEVGGASDLSLEHVAYARMVLTEHGIESSVEYEYHDSIADGLVVRQEDNDEGGVTLYISAGRDDAQRDDGMGEVRGAYLRAKNANVAICFSVASSGTVRDGIRHYFEVSDDDGATWHALRTSYGAVTRHFSDSYYGADGPADHPTDHSIHILADIMRYHPDLAGREIRFRMKRAIWHNDSGTEEIDAVDIPGTLVFSLGQERVALDSIERIGWEDVPAEKLAEDGSLYREYTHDTYAYIPYRLRGNFQEHEAIMVWTDLTYYTEAADTDGEFLLALEGGTTPDTHSFAISRADETGYTDQGSVYALASEVVYVNCVDGAVYDPLAGQQVGDAARQLADWFGIRAMEGEPGELRLQLGVENSAQPKGTVARWEFSKAYDADDHRRLLLYISNGTTADATSILPAFGVRSDLAAADSPYAPMYIVVLPGEEHWYDDNYHPNYSLRLYVRANPEDSWTEAGFSRHSAAQSSSVLFSETVTLHPDALYSTEEREGGASLPAGMRPQGRVELFTGADGANEGGEPAAFVEFDFPPAEDALFDAYHDTSG